MAREVLGQWLHSSLDTYVCTLVNPYDRQMRFTFHFSQVFGVHNVVVTASRQESIDWAKKNCVNHTGGHREPLAPQLEKLGLVPSLAFICYDTANNVKQLIPVMRPF